MDENNRTNKTYQAAKEEIEQLKVQLQEMQIVHNTTESSLNSDLENLKAELSQKSQLQAVISELEQQLSAVDFKHKEEVLFVVLLLDTYFVCNSGEICSVKKMILMSI